MIQDINTLERDNIKGSNLEKIQRFRKDCQVRAGKFKEILGGGLLIQDPNKEPMLTYNERVFPGIFDSNYDRDSDEEMDKLEQEAKEWREEEE